MQDPTDPTDPTNPTALEGAATAPQGAAYVFGADEPYEDPAAASGDDPGSAPLDDVVAALTSAPVEDGGGEVPIAIPGRPGIVAVFHDRIPGRKVDEWRKQAKVRGDVDVVKFGGIILANTSVRLERNGVAIIDPETGEPATLRSPWLHRLYGAPGTVETARRLFGKDGYLNAAAMEVMAAAGWGSELAADPT